MTTSIKNPFPLRALIICFGLLLAGRVTAQTFTNLHNFTNSPDGANPRSGLILSGNTFYGITFIGGSSAAGTVFRINNDGTSLTNLHSFPTVVLNKGFFTNSDGAAPVGNLVLSDNTLYGATSVGGHFGTGTIFSVNTDGTGFTNIYNFTANPNPALTNSDGARPASGLTLSGNTLYGTTSSGGTLSDGTVFAINIDGTDFTNLHNFASSDGRDPQTGLIVSGNVLYGTTANGGANLAGTIFRINTDGTGFTNVYSFTQLFSTGNNDGANPEGSLILSGNTLYGTTEAGGNANNGAVFRINTDGTDFTNIHNFTVLFGQANADGAQPFGNLIISGNTLYGTGSSGGNANKGNVFSLNTDGTGFINLQSFTATSGTKSTNSYGAAPMAGLLLSNNRLYGMASAGGSTGNGAIFSLSLPPPQLTIISVGTNVIVTWPMSATGFTLQSTTNLVPPIFWNTVSGQNAVTNPISGSQMFYRLSM